MMKNLFKNKNIDINPNKIVNKYINDINDK